MNQRAVGDMQVHQAVQVLLPWYANGTLTGQELHDVATHLDTCPTCQADLAQYRTLRATLQAAPVTDWAPSPAQVARVMGRIEAYEARRTRLRDGYNALRAWVQACRELLEMTPYAVRWTLAAQAMLVLALAGVVTWSGPSMAPGPYRTLSDGTAQVAQPPPGDALRVVFAADMTVDEMQTVLTSIGGTLLQGPSPLGVYTVGAAPQTEPGTLLSTGLATLRAHPKVRLAEPLPRQ